MVCVLSSKMSLFDQKFKKMQNSRKGACVFLILYIVTYEDWMQARNSERPGVEVGLQVIDASIISLTGQKSGWRAQNSS